MYVYVCVCAERVFGERRTRGAETQKNTALQITSKNVAAQLFCSPSHLVKFYVNV